MSYTKLVLGAKALLAGCVLAAGTMAFAQTTQELENPDPEDWPAFGRTLDGQRFSPLTQITPENAGDLRMAWIRSLPWEGSVQLTPVVYDGVMYVNMPTGVLALDAANGQTIWEYTPELREGAGRTMRGGVVVYEGKIYQARTDGVVVALDAATGEEIWSNPITDIELSESFTGGPVFADGKILVGPAGADAGGNPGRIHALDAENGELLWTFNVIPGPEDAEAFATWDPRPTGDVGYGGGSAWTPGVYDPVTRTVVWGTGQPNPWDRYEIRRGSADLYTASFVALDVDTGELKWHHQVVPADEWDYDQHVTPVVADVEIEGEQRRVAILATTSGFIVVIDVETGEFIDAHRMALHSTVHLGYEDDGTPIIDDDYRPEPNEPRLVCPIRWASYELGTFSPETGLLYRPNDTSCINWIVNPLEDDWQPGQPAYNFEIVQGGDESLPGGNEDLERWGALSAIDPATGEVVWEFTTGYGQRAGAVSTAGGVVFGAFADRTFRAFDSETGEVLWEQLVSSTTSGNPISYAVDGVQYVAVPVGGFGGSAKADLPPVVAGPATMFVFSLPADSR